MDLKKILFVSLILIVLNSSLATAVITTDKIYPLKNNDTISLSKIFSFQNDIISEYNKNFERYPPQNEQLYHIFFLNSSFNSTILLSYDGSIGFYFEESKIPTTVVYYLNETQSNQPIDFLGLPIGGHNYFNNVNQYFSDSYAHITNIYSLNRDLSRRLALNYYLYDYARYVTENARLKQVEEANLQKLNKSLEELYRVYQSGDDLEKAKVTLQFYQLADEVGYPDAIVKKIIYGLKNKNSTQLNNSENESSVQSKSVNESKLLRSDFLNNFNSYIVPIIIVICVVIGYFLNFRRIIKERNEIKNEIKSVFNSFYTELYTLIKPRLLQIRSQILRQRKEGKH